MKKRILAAVVAAAMLLTAMLPCALAEREDKKEMVYVLADATGEVNEIIVSEHLYNRDREAQLRDVSRLTDIENVGEDMTFTTDGDAILWNANGNDVRYEGVSTEPLPVDVHITYTLDGVEIAPEELKGKSGHDVDFACFRISQHSHEFGSGCFLGAGDTIVRIHASINPFGVHLDQLAVMADLRCQ